MKKSSSRKSESSTQFDSAHSPLRFKHSPLSDDGDPPKSPPIGYHTAENSPENSRKSSPKNLPENSTVAIVPVPQHHSPARTPLPVSEHQTPLPENGPSVFMINRATREEPPPSTTNLGSAIGGGGHEDGGGGRGRPTAAAEPPPARPKREDMVRKAALGFRLSEVVLCLISFSVMAADKTQGWSGDSFDRYKEYRYCLAVNVIAFAYAGFQACDLAYQLVKGKHVIVHHLRYHFDFFMDQVLAYLLISASSSAATRVDDWQSNWGKDEFTEMASASVGLAFLAFIAFAISSLISGYNLCSLYP